MDGCHGRTAVFPRFAFFTSLLLAFPALPAAAATVVAYDFDDGTGGFLNAPALIASHLSAEAWGDTDKTLTAVAGNPGKAASASHFHDGNAFELKLLVEPGHVLSVDGYSFDHRVSNTGPTLWILSLGGTQVANGTTVVDEFTSAGGTLGLTGLTGEVTVSLYAAGAGTKAGTWRIDNFQLLGGVDPLPAPLPASALLLLSALICLPRRRRG
jgi:hypothetical protein